MAPTPSKESAAAIAKRKQNLLVFITAVFLLILLLVVVLWKDNLSAQAFWIVRIIGTLAAAGFGTLIPGYFEASGVGWKATGAVAFGAVAYFFNPAPLDNHHQYTVQGTVMLDGKPQQNIVVNIVEKEMQKITNTFGKFLFTIEGEEVSPAFSFQFKFTQPDSAFKNIDTTITFSNELFSKSDFKIYLKSDSLPPQKTTIAGKVYNSTNGAPLENVMVTANGTSTKTDGGGFFSFRIFTNEKRIAINFSRQGFESRTLNVKVPYGDISIGLNKN